MKIYSVLVENDSNVCLFLVQRNHVMHPSRYHNLFLLARIKVQPVKLLWNFKNKSLHVSGRRSHLFEFWAQVTSMFANS